VAAEGEEASPEVADAADVVVDGPAGALAVLRWLAGSADASAHSRSLEMRRTGIAWPDRSAVAGQPVGSSPTDRERRWKVAHDTQGLESIADLRAEVRRLSETVALLQAQAIPAASASGDGEPSGPGRLVPTAPPQPDRTAPAPSDARISRRGALALGAAAAVGIGALADSVLSPTPAWATTGNMQYGASNNAGTAVTALTTDTAADNVALYVQNNATGSYGLYGVVDGESDLTGIPGSGVVGDTSGAGAGVLGLSTHGPGVYGYSGSTYGVSALTTTDVTAAVYGNDTSTGGATGVLGESVSGNGVKGTSTSSVGVLGVTFGDGEVGVLGSDGSTAGATGVLGESVYGTGVKGTSTSSFGVQGVTFGDGEVGVLGSDVSSDGGYGVKGESVHGTGVAGYGSADSQVGVLGSDISSGGGFGVKAQSQAGIGLYATTANPSGATVGGSIAVVGDTATGSGVWGVTNDVTGVGVMAESLAGPSLAIVPFGSTTLPTSASPGQFIVLSDGSLWYCATADEWTALGSGSSPPSVVTIDPVRVINTTNGTGGITGPLSPGSTVHTSTAIAGTNGIPADATGILANFAISGVGGATLNGFGVATIFPAGTATPATANINAGAGCFAISNAVSVSLGTGGSAGKVSIVWGGGGAVPEIHAFLDVTGYIL
jgi:hypothetical protein